MTTILERIFNLIDIATRRLPVTDKTNTEHISNAAALSHARVALDELRSIDDEDVSEEIIDNVANCFFANAWADYQDLSPDGCNLSGCEITDIMPDDVPYSATAEARRFVGEVMLSNNKTITHLYLIAKSLPDKHADRECSPEMFGWYLAMQGLGHGVGLESVCNKKALAIDLPHTDYGYMDLPEDEYPTIEEEEHE